MLISECSDNFIHLAEFRPEVPPRDVSVVGHWTTSILFGGMNGAEGKLYRPNQKHERGNLSSDEWNCFGKNRAIGSAKFLDRIMNKIAMKQKLFPRVY